MRKTQITKPIARRRSWYNESTANKPRLQRNARVGNNATQTYNWIRIHDCNNMNAKTQFLPKRTRSEKSHRCCVAHVEFLKHHPQYIAWAKKMNKRIEHDDTTKYQIHVPTKPEHPANNYESANANANHSIKKNHESSRTWIEKCHTMCNLFFNIYIYIYIHMSVHVYKYVYISTYIYNASEIRLA